MTLSTIIEELEAQGPSYALDLQIAQTLVPAIVVMRRNDCDTENVPHTYRAFTANLNDAMWLAALLLDDGSVDIEVAYRSVGGIAHGRAEICGPRDDVSATAPTPASALCIALLRALEARSFAA